MSKVGVLIMSCADGFSHAPHLFTRHGKQRFKCPGAGNKAAMKSPCMRQNSHSEHVSVVRGRWTWCMGIRPDDLVEAPETADMPAVVESPTDDMAGPLLAAMGLVAGQPVTHSYTQMLAVADTWISNYLVAAVRADRDRIVEKITEVARHRAQFPAASNTPHGHRVAGELAGFSLAIDVVNEKL